jgi:hypothetical protein
VVKHTAVPKEMHTAILKAKPFDSEEEAIDAVLKKVIRPGDAVNRIKDQKEVECLKCFIQQKPFLLMKN